MAFSLQLIQLIDVSKDIILMCDMFFVFACFEGTLCFEHSICEVLFQDSTGVVRGIAMASFN